MKTQKIIAVCLLSGASFIISNASSAQVRLGAVTSAHLSSAASVNTPSVNNALRASTAATTATAGHVKTSGTAAAKATTSAAANTAEKTEASASATGHQA